MTSASMEVAIWKLLEQLEKLQPQCPICGASNFKSVANYHAPGCDFWDKLKLMRSIISDNGDDRE